MKYFCLLTSQGEQCIAEATALGTKIAITQMAVSDGVARYLPPNTQQTQLINESRQVVINQLWVDKIIPTNLLTSRLFRKMKAVGGYKKWGSLIKRMCLLRLVTAWKSTNLN